ncbi:MAG: TlpA family protein disulfide reductase [Lachnospiraceae bacterium]|nr:TlpA family protein disulfide reductase [Lachnospiraceae bacterium]
MYHGNRLFQKYAALCAVLLLMTGCGSTADSGNSVDTALSSPAAESVAAGETQTQQGDLTPFPAFTATALDGSTVTESIFSEKDLTVLNIWGTFCGPCIGEMPELGEWAKEMPDNVQILGLIIDINGEEDTEHRDLAVDITQKAGADFTNLIANMDFAPILKDVVGVPTTLFVDGEGNLVGDPVVGANVDGYKTFVEEYLGEQ